MNTKLYVVTTLFEGQGYETNVYSHLVANVNDLKDYLKEEVENYKVDWSLEDYEVEGALEDIDLLDTMSIPTININSRCCYIQFIIKEYTLKLNIIS